MTTALVGYTGYVGKNLLLQRSFDDLFNSTNITEMRGRAYEEVWFSGIPATKWLANKEPEADLANIRSIQEVLDTIRCDRLVLISTIDVYNAHEPYGKHRKMFEDWAVDRFPDRCVARLPSLFGVGMKKNLLFDLLTGHMVDHIHAGDAHQWYDLADLVADIDLVRRAGGREVDLFPEPVEHRAILDFFPEFEPTPQERAARRYSFRSPQAGLFGREDYIRTAEEILDRMGTFLERAKDGAAVTC